MPNKRYAIWYEPSGDVYVELKKIITDLAAEYRSPIFEPHITLLPGGSGLDKDTVVEKIAYIAKTTTPFRTTLTTLDYLDEYSKCLFILVDQTSELLNFSQRIQQVFNGKVTSTFKPHLSLMYGKFSDDIKDKIIQSLGKNYNKQFVLQQVDVIEYELGLPPETWKKVASLEIA